MYLLNGSDSYMYIRNPNLTFFFSFLFRINETKQFTLFECNNLLIKYELDTTLNVYKLAYVKDLSVW